MVAIRIGIVSALLMSSVLMSGKIQIKHVEQMKLYELDVENFSDTSFQNDGIAFQLLKEKPLQKPIAYLAAAWVHFIRHGNFQEIDQSKKVIFEEGFTIAQHIHYRHIIPIIKAVSNIKVIFTPHAQVKEVIDGIAIEPFPLVAANGAPPAQKKDIYVSFIGSISHPLRKKIFKIKLPANCILKKRDMWHYYADKETQEVEMKEYKDVLSRSRFSLCPRGTGVSSLRFWESLQAGAIPILMSDKVALPKGVDWDACIIRVAERDIMKIPQILSTISPSQEKIMRENCLQAYKLCSGENLVRCIRLYYGELIHSVDKKTSNIDRQSIDSQGNDRFSKKTS